MIIIRPIQEKDLSIFEEFSFESLLGMTNLPRNREPLLKKILYSQSCFQEKVEGPGKEEYFFVLEDVTTNQLGGICGILANSSKGFSHYYLVTSLSTHSKFSFVPQEIPLLKPMKNKGGSSEICSLYLHPPFRHSGHGRLLSLSRFLFIAAHRTRFQKKIVAELRGYIDEMQQSPFWNAVGHHFCSLSFVELMEKFENDLSFIPDIIPSHPLYIDLLPQEAKDAIGEIHPETKPAREMLLNENFKFNQEIDVFEGGPILNALTAQIRSIKKSRLLQVEWTKESLKDETLFLLSNEKLLDFRACIGNIRFLSKDQGIIHEDIGKALLLYPGDKIRYITLH